MPKKTIILLRRWLFIPNRQFKIEWDKNYGIDNREGWSVVMDGSVLSELQPSLVWALFEAWWSRVRTWDDEAIWNS
jgi:hypothetical protein